MSHSNSKVLNDEERAKLASRLDSELDEFIEKLADKNVGSRDYVFATAILLFSER